MNFYIYVFILFIISLNFSCSSLSLKDKKLRKLKENKEYDSLINIKEIPGDNKKIEKEEQKEKEKEKEKEIKDKNINDAKIESRNKISYISEKRRTKEKKKKSDISKIKSQKKDKYKKKQKNIKEIKRKEKLKVKRYPTLEDSEGFIGRRPKVDPFSVGELIKMEVTYFGMPAGYLFLEVLPFVEVNNKKSYHFRVQIKSHQSFSWIYEVHDVADVYMDYENLFPYSYSLDIKETNQVSNTRLVFDWSKLLAHYWEKKIDKDDNEEIKKLKWKILKYSQNVFSALFYMRVFTYKEGKKLAFRVSNMEENLVFKGKVIKKEVLNTEIGKINTVVVKPKIELEGVMEPVGDILIWLSDDEKKQIIRIESKIKIGKLKANVIERIK